jgi:tetratricopeptide (TPR) repeat protein
VGEGGEGFGGGSDFDYRAVETVAAMNAGMYKKAMELASTCSNGFSSGSSIYAAQYILLPTFVSVRLGKWNEILETYTDASSTYTGIMVAFAKGLASVRKNNRPSARSYLDQIRSLSSRSELRIPDLPLMDSPIKAVRVAHKLLEAEILASENNMAGAIASFKDAIRFEDEMVFYQPRNWLIPARQYLGAFLLKSGKIEEAMHCYEEDLERNPGNGWSQIGIYQCLMKKGESAKAEAYQKKYRKIFAKAELIPEASVY